MLTWQLGGVASGADVDMAAMSIADDGKEGGADGPGAVEVAELGADAAGDAAPAAAGGAGEMSPDRVLEVALLNALVLKVKVCRGRGPRGSVT